MFSVNEKSTIWVTFSPKDKNGSPEAPTAAYYQIDCLTSGTSVVAETEITTPSANMEIEVSSTTNALVSQANRLEEREITCRCEYGVGDEIRETFRFRIKNLAAVT